MRVQRALLFLHLLEALLRGTFDRKAMLDRDDLAINFQDRVVYRMSACR
jgi:hypothetical protein